MWRVRDLGQVLSYLRLTVHKGYDMPLSGMSDGRLLLLAFFTSDLLLLTCVSSDLDLE